jgi:AcrR family transcriptional regulator
VGSAEPRVVDRELGFVQHSAARTRVLDAALDLFAQHGVSGTSLQMIADAVGITKAAVYHQFRTKDNIVLAVTERELFRLAPALDAAEAHSDELTARDELLVRMIEMAVRDRRLVRTLQFDPVVVRLLAEQETFQRFMERLYRALLGETDDNGRIEGAMLSGAISSAVMHPLVADVDDDTLQAKLTEMSRRLLNLRTSGDG